MAKMQHKIEVLELFSTTDISRMAEIANTKGVVIDKTSDFFGVVPGADGEGGSPTISRVVEFREPQKCPNDCDDVYQAPMA